MTDRGDILRVRLLDAACIGCGRPVTVWQGWGVVVTADRDGERHACGLDSRARVRENGVEEVRVVAGPATDILWSDPARELRPHLPGHSTSRES